jgi:hypothetical protein
VDLFGAALLHSTLREVHHVINLSTRKLFRRDENGYRENKRQKPTPQFGAGFGS